MKRLLLLLPVIPVAAASFFGTAASGCGACCQAACVSGFSVGLTGPGGAPLQEFHGTYTIEGEPPWDIHCVASASGGSPCTGFGDWERGTPPALRIDLESALDGASFHGVVDLDYHEEKECCDTCQRGRAEVELIANP